MKRLSMVLALAVWTAGGCTALLADDSLFGCIHNCLNGHGAGCGDSCSCGDACGCCDTCGSCAGRGAPGGICDCIVSDCANGPICQCARNCGLFQRYCGCGSTMEDCGGTNYDYSACGLRGHCYGYGVADRGMCGCGGCGYGGCGYGGCGYGGCGDGRCGDGGGCGCGPRVYGGCNNPYGSGCCCSGPGCCASGDQHYTFNPGPPVGQTAYPYYTTRGPRDFLLGNPPPIGPY